MIPASVLLSMFKKTLFQLHWFLGITAGLILSLMGVTGAIYSYDQQILEWLNPESYTVYTPKQQEKLSPAELYQQLTTKDQSLQINSITIVNRPDASTIVNIKKEGERRGLNLMVNPYDASVLPTIKGKDLLKFIEQLHRNLTFGPVGQQITGACALMLIFFVLSGLYLRWPKKHSFKQWLSIKPKLKGRNFIWDLHAVVGTWVVVFYLIFSITGLYWSYDWWREGMFKVLGVDQPQPAQMATKPVSDAGTTKNNTEQNNKLEKKNISSEQIIDALTQTWQGFNQQYQPGYSSITFNLPKSANGKVELSFFDRDIQHERARNSAIYNYTNHSIDNLKLYSDKKLNEKIMSSMLPVHRGSFFGPIWQFVAMIASLIMPLFFITGMMLYLKKRKQKKLTQTAKQHLISGVEFTETTPWLIIYASQTGMSEQIAWHTATSLQEAKQTTHVKSIQHIDANDLKHKQILFVVSTYGMGEAPDTAISFSKKIMPQTIDLSHVQYAVLALGSTEYFETYCHFGHNIDTWLEKMGATRLFDTIEVDDANNEHINQWNQQLARVTQLELQEIANTKTFDHWTLNKRQLLNSGSLGNPAYHLELTPQHTAIWQAGDIAEIQPMNSPQRIINFIQQQQLGILSSDQMQALQNKDLTQNITTQNSEEIIDSLPLLPTREYSIASIPTQGSLHLVVRLSQDTDGEYGLGSGWLCQHAMINQEIALRIRNNESFHLIDDNRPIILIGNGTGIAGLMSLLQQRHSANYHDNWLIFGERQRSKDFFYQPQLQKWVDSGFLTRLDLAFSQDSNECQYVQHQLIKLATEVQQWIERGAIIYVCGSIKGMANGVNQALIDILGEAKLDQLREENRYRRDVY